MTVATPKRDRIAARPFIGKGIKFSLAEWAIVSELMDLDGHNFTDLMKDALREKAHRKGLYWPTERAPRPDTPVEQAS